jgi:co-chaperonin GroES (HSP10)
MSKQILEPANDRVLVADVHQETTLDGIALPDNVRQQEMVIGTVIFVGPKVSSATKPKDIVYYGPYAGKTVAFGGMEFRLLLEGQIEGYLRESHEGSNETSNAIV